MAVYPEGESDRRVGFEALRETVAAIFERRGMAAEDAALLADQLATADLRGVHSHGCIRVPDYVKRLGPGGVDPKGRPRVTRDAGAALVVDGGNAMGQIAAAFAMDRTIERARIAGVAFAAVGGSNHCGAMAYYAVRALQHDMIGICATNALPTMAPWGGIEKLLGINPLAVAIPAAEEPAIVYDAAFSGSSHGKIRVFRQKGLRLPEGWALDSEGRPTDDPAVAVDGLLAPIGWYKGTGMAIAFGLLSTLLSGAAFGSRLGDMTAGAKPGRDGHFCMALNLASFGDPARMKAEVDDAIRELRASRRAAGVERIYLPGEPEAECERAYRQGGVPLNAETLAGVAACARELGVDVSALA
jgi:LDH2 family malate/lactate/ureidoglycolate dehydrogenase